MKKSMRLKGEQKQQLGQTLGCLSCWGSSSIAADREARFTSYYVLQQELLAW